jgi:FkbM family methyltransferase
MTSLSQLLRNAARRTVDSFSCSWSPKVRLVGNKDSGWFMHTGAWPKSAYCAGVGGGISFEQELALHTPRKVLVFDPSPTGIATMERTDQTNLSFFPVGLAVDDGTIEFSPPDDPNEGSFSVAKEGMQKTSFECWSLATVMRKQGDTAIDLLKMDIEGFEFDIVDAMLRDRIPVRQLCVEFHPWLAPGRLKSTLAALKRAGYKLIYKRRGDYTFLLPDDHYLSLQQAYRKPPQP